MSFRRRFAAVSAVTATAAATAVALERTPGLLDTSTSAGHFSAAPIAAVRFTRALATATVVMADYRLLFARHDEYSSDYYKQQRSLVHKRSAERMLALARTQGAVYVKIGQHIASMNHAVPPEYTSSLKLLEDRAAYRPYPQIRRTVQRELGRKVEDVFKEFHRKPVAAASLAQVHFATLKEGGDSVAVKVQYPGLEALVEGDLASIRMLSWLLMRIFPYFDMHWVVDQFKRNLDKELNFILEGQSATRTAGLFEKDNQVCVPSVYTSLTTLRMLTMEYVDGFRVDDLDALRDAGIDRHRVAQTVVDAFAKMIFVNGFVHCDPHAGNLMVKPCGGGRFQLFLLDHGLYRQLNDDFRQSYCKLWKGLVLRRGSIVEKACEELGAPGFANLFSMFLLNRSWKNARKLGTDIRVKMSDEEMKQIRSDLREGGLKSGSDVSAFVEQIPEDLLLVFKMNSLVRNVNKALGASVNRFKVNARYAVRGLRHWNRETDTMDGSAINNKATILAGTHSENAQALNLRWFNRLGNWVGTAVDCAVVEIHLFIIDAALVLVRWWLGDKFRSTVETRTDGVPEELKLIG